MNRRLISLLCLLAALVGCAHEAGRVVSEKDMPSPETLFEKLTADPAPGKTLTGILHVVASLPRERYTFRIAASARRPDCLRLEDLSVIGLPNFILTAKEAEIRMFLPRSGEFLVGTESSEPVLRAFPSPVRPLDLVALLHGTPPGSSGTRSLKGAVDGSLFRLDVYTGGTWAQTLWVDPDTSRLVRVEIADRKGNMAYRALLRDFVEMGANAVPGRIEIETEGMEKVRLTLRNTDMELQSRDDDPDYFLLRPPEGITPRISR